MHEGKEKKPVSTATKFFSLYSGSGDNVVIRERDRKRISVSTMGRRSHCVREIRSAECERIGSPGCDLRIESFQNRLLFLLFFWHRHKEVHLTTTATVFTKKNTCVYNFCTHIRTRMKCPIVIVPVTDYVWKLFNLVK